MKDRIFRTKVLFKELGYDVFDGTTMDETYSGGFEKKGIFAGGVFIDSDSKFLEIAYSFSFSGSLGHFIKNRLNEMFKVCYEFGCYLNLHMEDDFSFSIFSKIYFSGLNYYSLRDTIKDFNNCIRALKEVIEISNYTGGLDENS